MKAAADINLHGVYNSCFIFRHYKIVYPEPANSEFYLIRRKKN
jgi:hypothetical protein